MKVPIKKQRNIGEAILVFLTVAILFSGFIRLGIWQLDRAQELQSLQAPHLEKPLVPLVEIAKPGLNLAGESVNRIVSANGHYIAQYSAPGQVNGTQTWSIGLLEITDVGAILIARSRKAEPMPKGEIEIIGRLMPRQFDDLTSPRGGVLPRIDGALLVAETDLALFDGFIILQKEKVDGSPAELSWITADPAQPAIPGFYWQHIAYVVIWWLAAFVVLFLPFYQRFVRKVGR